MRSKSNIRYRRYNVKCFYSPQNIKGDGWTYRYETKKEAEAEGLKLLRTNEYECIWLYRGNKIIKRITEPPNSIRFIKELDG